MSNDTVPAAATGLPADPDPILALIDAHRTAALSANVAKGYLGGLVHRPGREERRCDALDDAEQETYLAMVSQTTVSAHGLAALATHLWAHLQTGLDPEEHTSDSFVAMRHLKDCVIAYAGHVEATPGKGQKAAPPAVPLDLIDMKDALAVIRRDLRGVDLMARGAGSTLGAMYLMEPLCGALQGITEAIDDVELRIERAWTGAAA